MGGNAFVSIRPAFSVAWLHGQVSHDILRAIYTPLAWWRALGSQQEVRLQWTGPECDEPCGRQVEEGECVPCVCDFAECLPWNCCDEWSSIWATRRPFHVVYFDVFFFPLLYFDLLYRVLCSLRESLLCLKRDWKVVLTQAAECEAWWGRSMGDPAVRWPQQAQLVELLVCLVVVARMWWVWIEANLDVDFPSCMMWRF